MYSMKQVLLRGVGCVILSAASFAVACGSDTTVPEQAGVTSAGGAGGSDISLGQGGEPEPACGDDVCQESGGESCESCPLDCGDCPTCDYAPTCTGALSVPSSSEALDECNNEEQSIFACGSGVGIAVEETNCTDPQLRLRVRQLQIKRGNLITNRIYCVITAEDGAHSELLITPIQDAPYGDTTLTYPVSQSLFWGQDDLYASVSNITVTYDCYESVNSAGYEKLVDDVADQAADSAQNAGGYGWVFGAVAVAGKIISGALANVSDRHIVNVQQTIDADALLALTNSRTWTIQKEGGFAATFFNARLEVQSWGCARPTNKSR